MNLSKRSTVTLVALGALVLGVFIWRATLSSPSTGLTTVTAILPLTGPVAQFGLSERRGIELAVESIKAQPGNGQGLRVLFEDSRGQASDAMTGARKALSVDGSRVFMSSLTGPTKALIPIVTQQNGLLVMFAMDESLSLGHPNLARIYPGAREEGQILLRYIATISPKRPAVLQLRHPAYDQQVNTIFLPGLKKAGIDDARVELFDSPDSAVLRPVIDKLAAFKPDLLLICAYYNQLPNIYKVLEESGLRQNTQILVGLNLPIALTHGILPWTMAEGTVVAAPQYTIDGLSGDNPSMKESFFYKEYLRLYKTVPDYDAAYAYDATIMLADALKGTGSNDITAIARKLRSIGEHNGVSGPLKVQPDGNTLGHWGLGRIQKGVLARVGR